MFVPVFNVDGHERFGRWNRPNQRGPEEMGWRTTAQNLNLNRDYVKADTPEMQAMLRAGRRVGPDRLVDLHVTDGAQVPARRLDPGRAGATRATPSCARPARRCATSVIADLTASRARCRWRSTCLRRRRRSGLGLCRRRVAAALFDGYFWLRNRLGDAGRDPSWKDYPTRVRITHNSVHRCCSRSAQHGAEWRRSRDAADARCAALAGRTVTLTYKNDRQGRDDRLPRLRLHAHAVGDLGQC